MYDEYIDNYDIATLLARIPGVWRRRPLRQCRRRIDAFVASTHLKMNLPSPSVRWAVDCVAHPDERPYPFLSTGLSEQRFRFHNLFESNHERFLTFVCSDESTLCCQLSRLEAAVAIARTLQRTLVIPAAISRAHLDSYFNLSRLQRLVRVVSEQDVRFLLGERCNRGELVGLACATIRASAWMPWIEVGADCEAHSAAAASHFLSDFVAEVELCIALEEPTP